MDVVIDTQSGLTVVTMSGEIDGRTAPIAQEKALPACTGGATVGLELSAVTYLSSAGLRLLLLLHRHAAADSGRLLLIGVPGELQDTMSATGFLSHFTLFDTVEAAAEMMSQEPANG